MLNTPETYHVSTAETGVEKSDPSKFYPNPYNETKPLMPDLVDYPSSSRRSEAEDFAVRVEDFPIHVSQMRCSRNKTVFSLLSISYFLIKLFPFKELQLNNLERRLSKLKSS